MPTCLYVLNRVQSMNLLRMHSSLIPTTRVRGSITDGCWEKVTHVCTHTHMHIHTHPHTHSGQACAGGLDLCVARPSTSDLCCVQPTYQGTYATTSHKSVLTWERVCVCVLFVQLDQPLVVSVGEWSATVKLLEWPSALHTSPLPSSTTHTLLQVSYGQQTVSINGT